MCGGGSNLGGVLDKSFMTKNLLSGGLLMGTPASVKHTDSALRKDTLDYTREKGIIPAKKVTVDPAAERAAAEAAATQQANARIAFQRKAMRDNSLLTGGGQAAAGAGRTSLGV